MTTGNAQRRATVVAQARVIQIAVRDHDDRHIERAATHR